MVAATLVGHVLIRFTVGVGVSEVTAGLDDDGGSGAAVVDGVLRGVSADEPDDDRPLSSGMSSSSVDGASSMDAKMLTIFRT